MLAFWKQLHLERICFKQTIKTFLEYLLPEDDEGDDDHDDPDNSSANLHIISDYQILIKMMKQTESTSSQLFKMMAPRSRG